MAEWKECTLGDVLSLKRGYDLPKSQMRDGNIPVAGSNGIIGFHDEFTPITPCITIGRSGNIGNVYYYDRCWAHNTTLYVDDYKGNNPKYLYYFLKTLPIASYAGGSAVPTLNRNHIYPIKVCFCSNVEKQKEIADILSSLDDKIEVNRKINENLEQQAEALFKSWFVDFDPFKDGKFIDSELGKIPEGWRVGTLGEIIKTTLTGDWGKEILTDNYKQEVFCIRGADIPAIKIGERGKMPIRYILEKNFLKKKLSCNDLVVEISGGSPTQSTGRICKISDSLLEKYNNHLICTNFCRALTPVQNYSSYIYLLWKNLYNLGVMFSYENGTTGIKNLDVNSILEREKIIIPPIKIVADFERMIKHYEDLIIKNSTANEILSKLRDTLLPKLMSGEIKVE